MADERTDNVNVNVTLARQREISWFPILAVIFLAITYWQWVLIIGGTILVTYLVWRWVRNARATEEGLRARADQQLKWFLSGDPRAIFGADHHQEEAHGQEVGR